MNNNLWVLSEGLAVGAPSAYLFDVREAFGALSIKLLNSIFLKVGSLVLSIGSRGGTTSIFQTLLIAHDGAPSPTACPDPPWSKCTENFFFRIHGSLRGTLTKDALRFNKERCVLRLMTEIMPSTGLLGTQTDYKERWDMSFYSHELAFLAFLLFSFLCDQ